MSDAPSPDVAGLIEDVAGLIEAAEAMSHKLDLINGHDAAELAVLGAVDAALRQAFVLGLVLDASKTYRIYIDERGVMVVADDEPVIEQ